jgi:exonuclease III
LARRIAANFAKLPNLLQRRPSWGTPLTEFMQTQLHSDAALYTYWSYLRNRWPRAAGLRIDHLLLSALAAKRLAAAGVDRAVRGEAGAVCF